MSAGRKPLLDALAESGVTEADYRLVQKARRLIDQVNAGLAARGATVLYAVTCNPVTKVHPWQSAEQAEIHERDLARRD